ncbi:hypothetical protein [Methylocystis sp. ATCC 49242]|uniref:hypothetical protein n=1 Tax=Methylocystis sp. ATCC 49242 TaxID=622637 RepID=UPI0001F86AF2|nr:hypothetical protein [Methylocystis sp. ATCC 49242]
MTTASNSGFSRRAAVAALALAGAPPAQAADELARLRPGVYAPDCKAAGGAGTTEFDGANLSPHYQICRTTPGGRPHVFSQLCVESQDPTRQRLATASRAQLLADPDHAQFETTVVVASPTSFAMDGASYKFCGDPR